MLPGVSGGQNWKTRNEVNRREAAPSPSTCLFQSSLCIFYHYFFLSLSISSSFFFCEQFTVTLSAKFSRFHFLHSHLSTTFSPPPLPPHLLPILFTSLNSPPSLSFSSIELYSLFPWSELTTWLRVHVVRHDVESSEMRLVLGREGEKVWVWGSSKQIMLLSHFLPSSLPTLQVTLRRCRRVSESILHFFTSYGKRKISKRMQS